MLRLSRLSRGAVSRERAGGEGSPVPADLPGTDARPARRSSHGRSNLLLEVKKPMTARDVLLRKIQDRSATVAVVGLGYVGLPLAVEFAKAGFNVIGYDVSQRVVDLLNEGKSHIQDVPGSDVAALVKAKKFRATTDD